VHLRFGPGPVFVYEWLTAARRWQLYALRVAFVAAMLVGMMIVWNNVVRTDRPDRRVSIQQMANYGEVLYLTVATIELTLVLLAAPAGTAGSICLDKARGTLDHMLATDLSNAEIVLGKLGVRLVPVLSLIACVLPITALSGLLGGIDPLALGGSFLVVTGCAVLGCTLAMTLSVWGRKTHEVLMLTYLILILWLFNPVWVAIAAAVFRSGSPWSLSPDLWQFALFSNPYYLAYAPYVDPAKKVAWTNYLVFLGGCLSVSGLLASLATLRIRTVVLRQAGRAAGKSRLRRYLPSLPRLSLLPGPSLDGNPVLWREWHRSKPSRFLRVAWFLYSGLGVLWIVLILHFASADHLDQDAVGMMNVFQVGLGLLLVSVSAATSLAEERTRGSLDVLMSTPLSTRSILAGKWWGAFRQVRHVLIWPAVTVGLLVVGTGRIFAYLGLLGLIAAYGAAIISVGLALATWVSRLGRAVALCVAAYVMFSIGWLILVILMASPGRPILLTLMMGSPLCGTYFATIGVALRPHLGPEGEADVWGGIVLWILIHGGVALGLFAATSASFDRCMGRISETPAYPIPRSRQKPVVELEADD
jgi:ABC-type transport system involved in multi-copper enzyme maturation permease subunit